MLIQCDICLKRGEREGRWSGFLKGREYMFMREIFAREIFEYTIRRGSQNMQICPNWAYAKEIQIRRDLSVGACQI